MAVPMGYPLEPSPADMRAMAVAATDLLVARIDGLDGAPAVDLEDVGAATRSMPVAPSPDGRAFAEILEEVRRASAKGFATEGPGYLAYIPGGGLFSAAVAEYLAYGINRYVGVWNAAPALAQIEAAALRWLADLFDYPPEARGIFTTGGSLANFSAVVTARRTQLPDEFHQGVLYASAQTHASVAKAAVLAGFSPSSVRAVPTTAELAIDVPVLQAQIESDRRAGLVPFLVVGNAGTTNTGAVDPLGELADVVAAEGMWLHVDAAYGGFFQMTDRGRRLFAGIERADSVTLDPHKGMFLPYGTGCLLVRDGQKLRSAHQVQAEYLQDLAPEDEIPNFADYSPELSREFRGLRVWLPLQLHGVDAFRAALDEKLDLTQVLYRELAATPGFELPWEPQLTVVPFRYRPDGGDPEAFNRALLERINASKRVFLSSTLIDGRFVIRACIVSHRTHRDRIEEAVEIIRRAAKELAKG